MCIVFHKHFWRINMHSYILTFWHIYTIYLLPHKISYPEVFTIVMEEQPTNKYWKWPYNMADLLSYLMGKLQSWYYYQFNITHMLALCPARWCGAWNKFNWKSPFHCAWILQSLRTYRTWHNLCTWFVFWGVFGWFVVCTCELFLYPSGLSFRVHWHCDNHIFYEWKLDKVSYLFLFCHPTCNTSTIVYRTIVFCNEQPNIKIFHIPKQSYITYKYHVWDTSTLHYI